jgi:hypothetical protein
LSKDRSATSRLASSHFISPYCFYQRASVASVISSVCNTTANSLAAFSIASATRSFAKTSSDLCFFRRLFVIESLLATRAAGLHIDWISFSKAGHNLNPVEALRAIDRDLVERGRVRIGISLPQAAG